MRGLLRAAGARILISAIMGDASALDSTAGEVTQLLLLFAYSREDELAADAGGVELLNRAGITSEGLLTFFERLQGEQGKTGGMPALFSTHPLTADRIDLIRIQGTSKGNALTPLQWNRLKNICGQSGDK